MSGSRSQYLPPVYIYMKDLHDSELKHVHLNVTHVRSVYNFRYLQITIKYFWEELKSYINEKLYGHKSDLKSNFRLFAILKQRNIVKFGRRNYANMGNMGW